MAYLLNSMWQATALTALIWLLLKLPPRLSPATRYAIWWITLLAVVCLPLQAFFPRSPSQDRVSWVVMSPPRQLPVIPASPRSSIEPVAPISDPLQTAPQEMRVETAVVPPLIPFQWPSGPITRAVLAAWTIVSVMLLARIGYSYQALCRLKKTAMEPPEMLRARLARVAADARITRRARLLISDEIAVPIAIGFLDPVILIPPSLAEAAATEEFEHMALHELAHLARFDDFANLIQQLLSAVVPIQPALFWIGRHLNLEREAACDDRVVAVTGTAKSYASSLTHIAELALWSRGPAATYIALASGVASNRSQLYRRIHRLLDRRTNKRTSIAALPFLAAIAVVVSLFALTFSAPQLIALADATPASPPAPQPVAAAPSPIPEVLDMQPTTLPSTPGTQIHSIPAEPGEKLSIDLDLGNVRVTAWDQNQVQFKITQNGRDIVQFLQHHQITIGRQNHEVSLHAIGDGSNLPANVDIEYEITIPANFDLELKNQVGNAELSGLTGTISTNLNAGNIDADSCAGTLGISTQAGNITLHAMTAISQATTTDGNIEAAGCQSPLTLRGHNGNIDIAQAADVNAKTDNGNIVSSNISGAMDAATRMGNVEVRKFSGSALKAHTTMGNVAAGINQSPKSACSVTTDMGNVEVNLVRTAAVKLIIAAPMGNVDSDIPAGNINGGGPELRVSSQMGNVSVHKN